MKKFITILVLVAGLIGCSNVRQDCYYIYKIHKYQNNLCKYEIFTLGSMHNLYIVDTIGRWNVGDTILLSSQLQKETKAEK